MAKSTKSKSLPLHALFEECIKGTPKKAIIELKTILLCKLTNAVRKGGSFTVDEVFLTSKALKHIYDRRPQNEFTLILKYLPSLIKYPDHIRENKNGKRASICFTKKVDKNETILLCTLEISKNINTGLEEICVVTAFVANQRYLKDCKLMWSWKGGLPSS